MTEVAQSTLENLRLAIHGVTAPFSCNGTYVPKEPLTFIFKDHTRFEVTRAQNKFEQMNTLKRTALKRKQSSRKGKAKRE